MHCLLFQPAIALYPTKPSVPKLRTHHCYDTPAPLRSVYKHDHTHDCPAAAMRLHACLCRFQSAFWQATLQ